MYVVSTSIGHNFSRGGRYCSNKPRSIERICKVDLLARKVMPTHIFTEKDALDRPMATFQSFISHPSGSQ